MIRNLVIKTVKIVKTVKTVKIYISDKLCEMVYKGYFTYYNEEYEQIYEQ